MTSKVLMQLLGLLVIYTISIEAEQCLPGLFHKKTSSPASDDYAECKAWNADTCCTANFTQALNKTRVRELYGFHWGHCKNVSKKCEKFLIEEECFYQCEPRLFRWHVTNATIKNVPVCGDYCDSWYEACQDDETCVKDWIAGFNASNNMYTCPRGAECRTFKQMYGSGKELCDKMWGRSFRYVAPNCPCTRLDGPIPDNVTETSTCSGSSRAILFSTFYLLILIGML